MQDTDLGGHIEVGKLARLFVLAKGIPIRCGGELGVELTASVLIKYLGTVRVLDEGV